MAHSFNERIRAFQDAVRMKKNPYVPFFSNDGFWRIYDAGYKLSEVVYDYDKALDALLTYAKRYDVDTFLDIGDRNPLQISEVLGNKEYIIDDEHNTLVIKEQCHMTEDDYDKAAESPLAFLWENILVSKYSNFNKDMTPVLLQAAMGKFLEWNQRMEMAKAALREQCGVVPCNDGAHGGGPLFVGIEAYYDVYRGMKNLAKDMRRRPEKLKAACDAFFTAFVQPSVDNIQHVEDPQGAFYASMYTLCANLLSKKQIEEFLVPQAKIITEKIVETDNTLYILCEGTTRNIDDFLQDLPAGHFCLYVESDDIFEKRKLLPNICLQGGIPLTFLGGGSKEDCVKLTRKLVEEVGENGGLIVSPAKFASNPSDCCAENLRAAVDAAHGIW